MKTLVFDTGPIISLTTNNLLWLLEPLKERFHGEFCITSAVKRELVEAPLRTKRFKFEAFQVEEFIEKGILTVVEDELTRKHALVLLDIANNTFYAKNHPMRLVQFAEMETLAYALLSKADAIVVDERITRALIENPDSVRKVMEKRLHTKVKVNEGNLKRLSQAIRSLRLIRSTELAAVAFKLGLLDKYVVNIPNARSELLEGLLWGMKLNGCSITEEEIDAIKRETL